MPRQARIDAPGALHHIMARGIERRKIFLDNADRDDFIDRLGKIVSQSQTDCLAWALMPNHFHLLLRTGQVPIATVMRRLMSGYAIGFNLRHRRTGHLFQNRYKSILCDEETYLLELVRYIHLNPIRSGIVENLKDLDGYPYSGHSTIVGNQNLVWQNTDTVLGRFGRTRPAARNGYRHFLQMAQGQGRRPELTGGGLLRSAGGWTGVSALRKAGAAVKSDERILGDGEFVHKVLAVTQEALDRKTSLNRAGVDFDRLVNTVCDFAAIPRRQILAPSKLRDRVRARSLLCLWANRELGLSMTDLAARLGLSVGAVSIAVQRGEQLETEEKITLEHLLKL